MDSVRFYLFLVEAGFAVLGPISVLNLIGNWLGILAKDFLDVKFLNLRSPRTNLFHRNVSVMCFIVFYISLFLFFLGF